MNFRTDLALERKEVYGDQEIQGVKQTVSENTKSKTTRIEVLNEQGAQKIGKPIGKYITVEVPNFSEDGEILDERLDAVKNEISLLVPDCGLVLIVGLGNISITPDSLGPKVVDKILATRHISSELAKSIGLGNLRGVAAVSPGVLGQTGIETGEIIKGISDCIKPSVVITIDALASRNLSRLGCTVQLADTGVTPGSGVGNARKEINQETIGVPVIAVGIPTVVDATTLAYDLFGGEDNVKDISNRMDQKCANMIVTPREIDIMMERASNLVALAINSALQPSLSVEDIMSLTS